MAAEDEEAQTEEGEEDLPISDELIDEDMACVRCGYNLRGLKDEGQCPECGAQIEETLDFVMARVLCPTCLAPNHPTVSLCEHCGSPVTGAAATADYYRTKPIYGAKSATADEDEEPEAPSAAFAVACWSIGIIFLVKIAASFVSLWSNHAGTIIASDTQGPRIIWSLLLALISAVPLAIIYLPTCAYRRLRRKYLREHAAYMAKELAEEEREAADAEKT